MAGSMDQILATTLLVTREELTPRPHKRCLVDTGQKGLP